MHSSRTIKRSVLDEFRCIADSMRPTMNAVESMAASAVSQVNEMANLRKSLAPAADIWAAQSDWSARVAAGLERFADVPDLSITTHRADPSGLFGIAEAALSELDQPSRRLEGVLRDFEEAQRRITAGIGDLRLPRDTAFVPEGLLLSLSSVETLYETARLHEHLLTVALQPYRDYQKFALDQIGKLTASTSEVVRRNRFTVLDTAADLLDGLKSAFELSMLIPMPTIGPSSEVKPALVLDPNLFSQLGREIEHLDLEDEDEEEARAAVRESDAARVAIVGARLLELVHQIDTTAEREGRRALFKPTTKTRYAFLLIPTCVASDEDRFSKVLDYLYFLLYEGSGEAKRLLERRSKESLNPLWLLKHLRLGTRHDVDHGGSRNCRKNFQKVGEAYRSLIGVVTPASSKQWIRAQLALYEQIVVMLEGFVAEGSERAIAAEPSQR